MKCRSDIKCRLINLNPISIIRYYLDNNENMPSHTDGLVATSKEVSLLFTTTQQCYNKITLTVNLTFCKSEQLKLFHILSFNLPFVFACKYPVHISQHSCNSELHSHSKTNSIEGSNITIPLPEQCPYIVISIF